ncbi:MAG: NADP-dependent oxidoreductase, partial [Jatrophihabitantaceae bacterium]|nr:NADP-dependent oxidoreductase [Jatrophihabitantaceae bacterium]
MKAAVYYANGGPEVLQYEDVPEPRLHADGIIIEVKAIGIQGGDTLNRARGPLMSTPHIVGYQDAGIVHLVGERVTTLREGQHVTATASWGSHAELFST